MGWGIFTYIFGVIAVVGPFLLMYWYWKAASHKFREFSAAAAAREEANGAPPPEGPGSGA
jgi:hypothetical protein